MRYIFDVRVVGGAHLGRKKVERTLAVPDTKTLENLCVCILSSLEFEIDHLYEFSIDGRRYEGAPMPGRHSGCRTKLKQLGLQKGDTFSLLFDYGDNWRFAITVHDIEDGRNPKMELLSGRGDVEQYPYEDEWDDVNWEEDDWEEKIPEEDDDWDEEDFWDEDEAEEAPGTGEITWNYRTPEDLFTLAFAYKKARLWKKLRDEELFALRLADGRTAYISVMGNAGDHCAMGMYLGEEALETCRDMCLDPPVLREYEMREAALRQDCLQMILDNKEFLREEERQEVSVYAAGHGIRLAGKNAFPHFKKLKPSHLPWHLEGASEEEAMREGLSACLRMAEIISGRKPSSLGFSAISSGAEAVPLMEKQGDTYEIAGMLTLPPRKEKVYPSPAVMNEVAIQRLKHLRREDSLDAKLVMVTLPVQEKGDAQPYFPMALFAIHPGSQYVLPPVMQPEIDPVGMVNELMARMIETGRRPERIRVSDERTYQLLAPLAAALRTPIEKLDEMPELEDFLESFMSWDPTEDQSINDQAEMMADAVSDLLELPDDAFASLPTEIRDNLTAVLSMGLLPNDIARKLKHRLGL